MRQDDKKSSPSFPRKRESRKSEELDARLRGHDGLVDVPESDVLRAWLDLNNDEADLKKRLKEAEADLDAKPYAHYPKLTEAEIKTLVVDDKWLAALDKEIHGGR